MIFYLDVVIDSRIQKKKGKSNAVLRGDWTIENVCVFNL